MVMNSCPTPRKDGRPCQARVGRSGFCLSHDPALSEKRKAAQAQGGRNKSRVMRAQKLLLPDLVALDEVLSQVIAGVYRGGLSHAQGSSISALVSAKCKLRELSLRIREQTELADRIKKLEEQLHGLGIKSGANGTGARRLR
jgi:hypothetical protein